MTTQTRKADPLAAVGVPHNQLPRHVAIIMDGNGRWAQRRGFMRMFGHEQGAEAVRDVTRACAELDLGQLTLYAFSLENWKRPKRETSVLMRLLSRFLVNERPELMENNVRLVTIGDVEKLPARPLRELARTMEMTAGNRGLTLCLALSYGARQEIVRAFRRLGEDVKSGLLDPAEIDEGMIERALFTRDMPAPDLLIRTAGEMRVSNFLLWQISYAEFYVTDVLWPDFRRDHLYEALRAYSRRKRRYGGISD